MPKILTLVSLSCLALFGMCPAAAQEAPKTGPSDQARNVAAQSPQAYAGTIQLYGESHGVKDMLAQELETWQGYYRQGQRHLFLELAYFTAEFLNLWMTEADDTTLVSVYKEWTGTACHNPYTYQFYKDLKATCPQTIFHGTDVGHQYDTTGQRYLQFLEELKTVGNADVMGIYGTAHTGLDSLDYTGKLPCMANQLNTLLPGRT